MTDIRALIAEAERHTDGYTEEDASGPLKVIIRLTQALDAEHKRAIQARQEAATEHLRADKSEAERDRYRAEAESARKTGERILADALRYRAAIEGATKVLHLDAERELHDIREILARALNEGAADV